MKTASSNVLILKYCRSFTSLLSQFPPSQILYTRVPHPSYLPNPWKFPYFLAVWTRFGVLARIIKILFLENRTSTGFVGQLHKWSGKHHVALVVTHMCLLFTENQTDWTQLSGWATTGTGGASMQHRIYAVNITPLLQYYLPLFSAIMHLMCVNNMSCDLTGFINHMKFHKLPACKHNSDKNELSLCFSMSEWTGTPNSHCITCILFLYPLPFSFSTWQFIDRLFLLP